MNKNIKKLFTLVLPVTVLTLTSCNNGKKTLSFAETLDYVSSNYDIHSYDDVKGHYSVKLDNFNMDTTESIYDDYGLAYTTSAAGGLKGVQIGVDGIPAICMNSYILNKINVLYTKYSAISMEFITNIGIDFTYEVENGCLAITLGTTSTDGLLNILKCAFPVLNLYMKLNPTNNTNFETYTPEQVEEVKFMVALQSLVLLPVTAPLAKSFDPDKLIDELMEYAQMIAEMGIGMTPNSSAEGKLQLKITTDNEGFLNGLSFVMEATNLDLHMATGAIVDTSESKEEIPSYTFDVAGEFKLGFSIGVTF